MGGTGAPERCSPCRLACRCGQRACSVLIASFSSGTGAKQFHTNNPNCGGVTQGKPVEIVRQKRGFQTEPALASQLAEAGSLLFFAGGLGGICSFCVSVTLRLFLVLLPGRACESLLWPQHRGFIPRQSTAGPACLRECGFRAALQRCSSPFSQGDTSFLGVGFKSVDTHRPSFQLTSCLLTVEKKPRLAPTSSLWHPAQV